MLLQALTRVHPAPVSFFLFFLLLLAFPGPLQGETVYIEVGIPGEEEVPIPSEILGAFEDGIMDPFFQDWHIVCNGRKPGAIEDETASPNVGGMDYYVLVDTLYTANQAGFGDLSISYILKAQDAKKVLLQGGHSSREFEDSDASDPLEIFRLQGRCSALEILQVMEGLP